MLEENGQVVAEDGDFIWVQTQARSACSHCNVGSSCGTSVLGQWFGQRSNRIRVHNHLGLQIGQGAVVGIDEAALLKASFIAYLLPMLTMVAGAMFATLIGAGDGEVALWTLLGLGLGLLLLHRLGTGHKRGIYQAQLLRRVPTANYSLNIAMQRGTTS
jgi:sigma-E factor negative regulatory protein RseC